MAQSVETIFNVHRNEMNTGSDISLVWSTTHIPGMDNAAGGGAQLRQTGRRRLSFGSFVLGALLTMHCRVAASALINGSIFFVVLLILAVVLLANPLRHFEIYLGQWSISGPGRAFRIIPIFDGIGIAMCINAIVRAITCCTMAAIAGVYIMHSVSDSKLPFTYCRDFDLKPYDPVLKYIRRTKETGYLSPINIEELLDKNEEITLTTVGTRYHAWRNVTSLRYATEISPIHTQLKSVGMCRETYSGYPSYFNTPAYNFFYVEVVHYRSDFNFGSFNLDLMLSIFFTWIVLWAVIIKERIYHGRLIWNNSYIWFVIVPFMWTLLITITAGLHYISARKILKKIFNLNAKEIIFSMGDALITALYIHSSSVGTELIHGKGLNHYASGHIDPDLNSENVWHSCLLLLLTAMQSLGTATCAIVDSAHSNDTGNAYTMFESSMWVMPIYSQCAAVGNHSHLLSTLIFGGMMFSYMVAAFVLLKTALHTIFEYRVKLVFIEQTVVSILMLSCMGLSILFTTNGGIALLEGVESVMSGLTVPFVCLLEMIGLLYVYRNRDFISDMNVATEDNTCSSRIAIQWQIIPFLVLGALVIKICAVSQSELPALSLYVGIAPLACTVLALPLRAAHNAYMLFGQNRARAPARRAPTVTT